MRDTGTSLRCCWLLALAACSGADTIADETRAAGQFPPVSSFSNRGPFATVVETPALSGCTIHRPQTLGANGVTHPVILWGNGTGASPSTYSALLSHWASHGFIVAAANTSNAGNGTQMIRCLDFVLDQNDNPGSAFFENVDPERIGTSGHSQGGAGSVMAGRDARVTATAPVQPYIGFIPGGGRFQSASIRQQHAPMFLVSGANDSIATPGTHQEPIFEGAPVFIAWGTHEDASHFEPVGNAGDFRGPLTAWFRSELMDDTSARRVFEDPCTLCQDPNWDVQFND